MGVQSQENNSGELTLIAADAVLPMDPALPAVLREAGVVISGGTLVAVGELADVRREFGELRGERMAGVLLPGFVNGHTHFELSGLAGGLRMCMIFRRGWRG